MSHWEFSERFLQALRTGDVAAMREMLDPDFEVVEADSLPYGGTYRGIDGWLTLSKAVIAAWAGFRLELLDVAGEGADSLVLHFAMSGRSRVSGRPFATRVLEYWRFRDGKLLRIDPFYFDTNLLATIDATPHDP